MGAVGGTGGGTTVGNATNSGGGGGGCKNNGMCLLTPVCSVTSVCSMCEKKIHLTVLDNKKSLNIGAVAVFHSNRLQTIDHLSYITTKVWLQKRKTWESVSMAVNRYVTEPRGCNLELRFFGSLQSENTQAKNLSVVDLIVCCY